MLAGTACAKKHAPDKRFLKSIRRFGCLRWDRWLQAASTRRIGDRLEAVRQAGANDPRIQVMF